MVQGKERRFGVSFYLINADNIYCTRILKFGFKNVCASGYGSPKIWYSL